MTSKGSRQVLFVEELKKAVEKSERPGRALQRPERRWEEMGEGPRENQLDFFLRCFFPTKKHGFSDCQWIPDLYHDSYSTPLCKWPLHAPSPFLLPAWCCTCVLLACFCSCLCWFLVLWKVRATWAQPFSPGAGMEFEPTVCWDEYLDTLPREHMFLSVRLNEKMVRTQSSDDLYESFQQQKPRFNCYI